MPIRPALLILLLVLSGCATPVQPLKFPAPVGARALSFDAWDATLWRFQNEMHGPNRPDEIYALFSSIGYTDAGNIFIHVRDGQASLQWQKKGGIYFQRGLSRDEFASLKQWLVRQSVDMLPSRLRSDYGDRNNCTYAHFTADGVHTFTIETPNDAIDPTSVYALMPQQFRALVTHGDFQLHYYLEERYPGTHILIHDPTRRSVCIVNDNGKPAINVAGNKWFALRDGRLAEMIPVPESLIVRNFPNPAQAAGKNVIRSSKTQWALLVDIGEIRISQGKLVTAPLQYVNLATGQIADVPLPPGVQDLCAGGFIESKNRFLVHAFDGPGRYRWWLFDPPTAGLTTIRGNLEPLANWSGRPLQPTGDGRYWLAAYDDDTHITRIGRYDFVDLAFQEVVTIPDIFMDNDRFYVNQAAGSLLLIANGDLLELPLPK